MLDIAIAVVYILGIIGFIFLAGYLLEDFDGMWAPAVFWPISLILISLWWLLSNVYDMGRRMGNKKKRGY